MNCNSFQSFYHRVLAADKNEVRKDSLLCAFHSQSNSCYSGFQEKTSPNMKEKRQKQGWECCVSVNRPWKVSCQGRREALASLSSMLSLYLEGPGLQCMYNVAGQIPQKAGWEMEFCVHKVLGDLLSRSTLVQDGKEAELGQGRS